MKRYLLLAGALFLIIGTACCRFGHPLVGSECQKCGEKFFDDATEKYHARPHTTRYEENSSCFVLCERCWGGMTKEQRLPFYERLLTNNVNPWPKEKADKVREAVRMEEDPNWPQILSNRVHLSCCSYYPPTRDRVEVQFTRNLVAEAQYVVTADGIHTFMGYDYPTNRFPKHEWEFIDENLRKIKEGMKR